MSKEIIGKVLDLFISKKGIENRINRDKIILDNRGVLEDKFYGKNIQRSVLLASIDSYNLAEENSININYGQLGENILIDYNPYSLTIGTQLIIGLVVLEISQHCTICKSFEKVEKELPQLLKNDRGIFAKVIKSGIIKQNDFIYLVSNNDL